MYMGVILKGLSHSHLESSIPHVYGGDPNGSVCSISNILVFPMYMGVILFCKMPNIFILGIPHVYGGDPKQTKLKSSKSEYSPCIWG